MRDEIRDLIERAAVLPQTMRSQHQWLVWRFVRKAGQDKPSKMPYYPNGNLRGWPLGRPADGKPTEAQPQVDQGHPLDREHLVSLDQALDALRVGRWDGLGFAFLPGDGLIGIDVDHAIDADGVMSDRCREIVAKCSSYTELSPSGTGVHVIVGGECKTFKSNKIGVEVFCGRQFFTVTARPMGPSEQVQPISGETLRWLHEMVRGPEAQMQPVASVEQTEKTKSDVFARVNTNAMALLDAWVPQIFPTAKRSDKGYRVPQRDLGRSGLEEDLSISSYGIVDFGVADMGDHRQGKRTPIDLVVEWKGLTVPDALRWLGQQVGVNVDPPRQRAALPPAPPITEAGPDGVPHDGLEEPEWVAASSPPPSPEGEEAQAPAKRGRGKGSSKSKELTPEQLEALERFYGRVDAMCERFTLIEPSETAWDHHERMIWQIKHMRISFTNDVVKAWLSRVASGSASKVKATDLVFEPGLEVAEHQINMFGGLPIKPVQCTAADVAPMLALLRHLCSATSGDPDEVDNVMEWVLRWQAYPLQHLGAKMQSACLFHGAQGTGKNLYWDAWRDLFGDMGVTVGQTELEDKSNAWISRKLAIIGDEVLTRQEMQHKKNALKMVVTQKDRFPIRAMYMDTRWESNHANVVFLSNELRPMALEDRDRRHMVIYTPLEAARELYESVRDFLRKPQALGMWLHYLQTYPLGDFTEHTKPPMTTAKRNLIQLNWTPSDRFAHEWMEGEIDLPLHPCSTEQLYRAFRRWCDRTGERFPAPKPQFTAQVERYGRESVQRDEAGRLPPPRLVKIKTQLIYRPDEAAGRKETFRKSMDVWLPKGTGPREGQAMGEFMAWAVDEFEQHLGAFCRTPGRLDEVLVPA